MKILYVILTDFRFPWPPRFFEALLKGVVKKDLSLVSHTNDVTVLVGDEQNLNPLMPGGNKKVTHTETNLQLNAERSAAGLFKYV